MNLASPARPGRALSATLALAALLVCLALAALGWAPASPARADSAPQAVGSLTCDRWEEAREYASVGELLSEAAKLGENSSVTSVTIDLFCDWNTHDAGRIVVAQGKSYTLNLHGHVLDVHKAGTYGSPWYAEGEGEAVHVEEGGTLTVNGGTGEEAQTSHAGTLSDVHIDADGNVTSAFWKFDGTGDTALYGGLITGGACDDHYGSGGISAEGTGCKVYLNDVTVAGNLTDRFDSSYGHGAGVAIHGKDSTLELNNSRIVYNHAEGMGGGVYVRSSGCTVTLKNGSEVSRNLAIYQGGGIMFDDGSLTLSVDSSSVSYNETHDDGGGIYLGGSSSGTAAYLYITGGSDVCHNHSGDNGGGIYSNTGVTARIDASSVSYNRADGNEALDYYAGGGGIYLYGKSNLQLGDGTEVSHNSAWGGGGGIEVEQKSTIVLDGAHIDANSAYAGNSDCGEGGGIRFIHGSTSSASDSDVMELQLKNGATISGNAADGRGGAIFVHKFGLNVTSDGTGAMSDNTVACTNSASDSRSGGGAIFAFGSSLSLSDVTLTDNYAAYRGGGIYYFTGTLSMSNVHITGNAAKEAAGGVWIGASLRCTLSGTIVVKDNSIKQAQDAQASANSNIYVNDSGGEILGTASQGSWMGFTVGEFKGQSYRLTGSEDIRNGLGDTWQEAVFSDDPAYSVAEWDSQLYLKYVASKYSLTMEWGSGSSASYEVAYGQVISLDGSTYAHPGYGEAPAYWEVTGLGQSTRLSTDGSGNASFTMPGNVVSLRAVYVPTLQGGRFTLNNSLTWSDLEEHADDAAYCAEHTDVLNVFLTDNRSSMHDVLAYVSQYISLSCQVETLNDTTKAITYTLDFQPALLEELGIRAEYSGALESFSARLISPSIAAVGGEECTATVGDDGGLRVTVRQTYREQCTVTFDPANGQYTIEHKVAKGSRTQAPNAPAWQGHVFAGWFKGTDEQAFDFTTHITENVTLVAKWTAVTCTVTFDPANGEDSFERQVAYGEPVARPDDPVRDGYTFLGWCTQDGQAYGFDGAVEGDLTLTAAWQEPATSPFVDVSMDAWYYDWVVEAAKLGLMSGYTDAFQVSTGYFGPEDQLTRAQVATVLWRIAGCPDAADGGCLPDVLPGRYYSRAVSWCVEKGVVTGYLSGPYAGTFRPDAPVSREELAVMVYRFASQMGVTTSNVPTGNFERCLDTGDVSSWAHDALVWCAAAGAITGKDTSQGLRLDPQDGTTRAQAAKVLVRINALTTGKEQPYVPAEQDAAAQAEVQGASTEALATAEDASFDEAVTFEDVSGGGAGAEGLDGTSESDAGGETLDGAGEGGAGAETLDDASESDVSVGPLDGASFDGDTAADLVTLEDAA